jgi:hypothetical protein
MTIMILKDMDVVMAYFKVPFSIFLAGLKTAIKNSSQDRQSPNHDMNVGAPKIKQRHLMPSSRWGSDNANSTISGDIS